MFDQPLVSAIVVCHNDWPHLEIALDSLLQQTYPSMEVIVVDNGSSDKTPEMIHSQYSSRVHYVPQENLRTAGGRNAGVARARGEFIQFLDGDDFLSPRKIAKQVQFLQANPDIDIAMGDFRCFRSDPDVPAESMLDCNHRQFEDMKGFLLSRNLGPPLLLLFRRKVIEKLGDQDPTIYNEDYEYLLRAAFAGFRFGYVEDCWSFYRRRRGQKSEDPVLLARADCHVLQRASRYVTEEPYRTQLHTRLSNLHLSLAHYHLWRREPVQAQRELQLAMRSQAGKKRSPSGVVDLLVKMPCGSELYALLRRLRGLQPPFAEVNMAKV